MVSYKKQCFCALFSLLFSVTVFGQLQSNLNTVFSNNQLMGMSVYVFNGTNENTYNYGLRNLSQNLLVNTATKYRIASVSKSVTALGLMKLFDQGLFGLDDSISTYLGYNVVNPNFPTVPITFRMLLSHTSSLQDGSGYNNFLTATYSQTSIPNISSVLTQGGSFYTSNMFRTEAPGSYFAYSNINYGLIGTLIEIISNQRFDVYMKNQILIPLGITGSYNIQDLTNIGNLATLYRNVSGWTPQFDNYNGIMPTAPNLTNYSNGTNGLYFSPQGGLRVSASEVGIILKFIRNNGVSNIGLVSAATLNLMKTIQWTDSGTNGDDYFGLFNKWSLGLHHANTNSNDAICNQNMYGNFIGHTGEAYGLISDAFYSANENVGFVFITNGRFNGYQTGPTSFYTVEDAVFAVLCSYFSSLLKVEDFSKEEVLFINPVKNGTLILKSSFEIKSIEIIDVKGALLVHKFQTTIDVSHLQKGVYFVKIMGETNIVCKKLIIE